MMEELFDFGEALEHLKRGQKVSHADWKPTHFLHLSVDGLDLLLSDGDTSPCKSWYMRHGEVLSKKWRLHPHLEYSIQLYLFYRNGNLYQTLRKSWTCSRVLCNDKRSLEWLRHNVKEWNKSLCWYELCTAVVEGVDDLAVHIPLAGR